MMICIRALQLGLYTLFAFNFLGVARAQHPLVLQRLQEWNAAAPQPSDQALIEPIKAAVPRFYPDKSDCIAHGITIESVEPATAERYVFQEVAFKRMKNAWTVTVNHRGCDAAQVRYMVMQGVDGHMAAIRVNRGRSYAHDSLIGDTLQMMMMAVEAKFSVAGISCGDDAKAKLGVVRIDKEEADLKPAQFGVRYSGSWSETWPIEKCGRTIEVPVSFTADGDGGAYYKLRIKPDLLTPLQTGK
jgi:hypothetical protein